MVSCWSVYMKTGFPVEVGCLWFVSRQVVRLFYFAVQQQTEAELCILLVVLPFLLLHYAHRLLHFPLLCLYLVLLHLQA